MSVPGTTITRAAVAESVDHWRGVKDPRSTSAKSLRKAEERGARSAAAAAAEAADAGTLAQLDRRAGAIGATRVLTPARIVQGRATAAEMPVERSGTYTRADVDALRARVAADEADSHPHEPHRTTRAAPAHSPEMRRRMGRIL